MDLSKLQPGDALLYKPKGLYGLLIRMHTGHPVGHVEVYLGAGRSTASRDKIGVDIYPLRTEGLIQICRPKLPFDVLKATAFALSQKGTPYGWGDLFNFIGLDVDAKGIVCSPWATLVYRAACGDPFNGDAANRIAPFQFATTTFFEVLKP